MERQGRVYALRIALCDVLYSMKGIYGTGNLFGMMYCYRGPLTLSYVVSNDDGEHGIHGVRE